MEWLLTITFLLFLHPLTFAGSLDSAVQRLRSESEVLSSLINDFGSAGDGGDHADSTVSMLSLSLRRDHLSSRLNRLASKMSILNRDTVGFLQGRVNSTLKEETARRTRWSENGCGRHSNMSMSCRSSESAGSSTQLMATKQDLSNLLEISSVISDSENKLEDWTLQVAMNMVDEYVRKDTARINHQTNEVEHMGVGRVSFGLSCSSFLSLIASKVRSAIGSANHDPLFDHATSKNGGTIMFGRDGEGRHWTSQPQEKGKDSYIRLGDAPWRRYIPEDWEALLGQIVDRWTEWILPGDLWLFFQRMSLIAKSSRHLASTVLDTQKSFNHIGSCYPVSTKHESRITIRLPYPILLTSIRLDASVVGGPSTRPDSVGTSLTLRGYKPCWMSGNNGSTENNCGTMGFDDRRYSEYGPFSFNAALLSQTFCISAPKSDQNEEEEHANANGDESSQCTTDISMSSCQADTHVSPPPAPQSVPSLFSGRLISGDEERAVVEAISIVFTNGDNDWFSCLSRVRVHGHPVTK